MLESVSRYDLKDTTSYADAKKTICRDLKNFLFKKTKRSPMILPIFID